MNEDWKTIRPLTPFTGLDGKLVKGPRPTLEFKVYLVGHGYEVDVFRGGGKEPIAHVCRDFGGTYRIGRIETVAIAQIVKAFEGLEAAIQRSESPRPKRRKFALLPDNLPEEDVNNEHDDVNCDLENTSEECVK